MITKYRIYRLINDDDVIARAEIVDSIMLLHNPMLLDVEFTDFGKVEVRLSPYTIYANTIKAFSPHHVLMVVEAPGEIVNIYNDIVSNIIKLQDNDEPINDDVVTETRILH